MAGFSALPAAFLSVIPLPAVAQSAPAANPTAEEMIVIARERYAVPAQEPLPRTGCGLTGNGEIIVCAPLEDPGRLRLESRLKQGDDSHLSWDGRAPDVTGEFIFDGPATAGGMCFFGPCPKPPVYIVDFDALPEPPPGSDAEAIAQGKKPAP